MSLLPERPYGNGTGKEPQRPYGAGKRRKADANGDYRGKTSNSKRIMKCGESYYFCRNYCPAYYNNECKWNLEERGKDNVKQKTAETV